MERPVHGDRGRSAGGSAVFVHPWPSALPRVLRLLCRGCPQCYILGEEWVRLSVSLSCMRYFGGFWRLTCQAEGTITVAYLQQHCKILQTQFNLLQFRKINKHSPPRVRSQGSCEIRYCDSGIVTPGSCAQATRDSFGWEWQRGMDISVLFIHRSIEDT